MEKPRTILNLEKGQSSFIKSIDDLSGTCKLLTLGILPKSKITLIRKSPMGSALYLKIDDHLVAIRSSEAKFITIE